MRQQKRERSSKWAGSFWCNKMVDTAKKQHCSSFLSLCIAVVFLVCVRTDGILASAKQIGVAQNQEYDQTDVDAASEEDVQTTEQGNQTESGQEQGSQIESGEKQQTGQEPETIEVVAFVQLQAQKKHAYISWEHVKGAVSYEIQRSTKQDGEFKNIAVLGDNRRKYTDTGVKRGNRYFYRVAAQMENGEVYDSDVISFDCPLENVSEVRLVRYSTSSIKVVWKKSSNKKAAYYKVYCAKSKTGDYKHIGTTKNTWFRAKDLENNQTYYFRVRACTSKKSSGLDSADSAAVKMKTETYNRMTIFAGDSITTGLTNYQILDEIAIGGNKNVVAAVGLNTTTFRTRKVFDGKSGLESIVAAQPYRVYIMLGVNEIHYRSSNDVIAGYREILQEIQAGSPNTDIVVLAASPVTRAQVISRNGFAQIPDFNKKLKALTQSLGIRYYDFTDYLKDLDGCLKSQYAAGDGFHWKKEAYHIFAKQIETYDKSLDN